MIEPSHETTRSDSASQERAPIKPLQTTFRAIWPADPHASIEWETEYLSVGV